MTRSRRARPVTVTRIGCAAGSRAGRRGGGHRDGFLAAHRFLRAQLGYTLLAPHGSFYLVVAGGLAVPLGIVALTLPLLCRITRPGTARND